MLNNLYVDFTRSVPAKGYKYHGGGNYTKRLLQLIGETRNLQKNVIVLWPKGYLAKTEEEESIIKCSKFTIQEVDIVDESIALKDNSVVFFPLLNARSWKIVKKIKQKYPTIKIYITIHGLRLLDLKPDKYDLFYHSSKLNIFFYSHLEYLIKKFIYKRWLKEYLPYCDKVFTVSNFSLQQITNICNVKFIAPYYQGIILKDSPVDLTIEEDYILFVSANRNEKNFMRALEAFCNYKKKSSNKTFLYVTGIDQCERNKIHQYFNAETKEIINKWVVFFEYVNMGKLNSLYKQCKFFLYTSKSEGFGLPVMEAIFNGRPVVASYVTSIPEVAGSAVYYVNPYDVYSIEKGLAYMSEPINLHRYENIIAQMKPLMKSRVETEQKILIDEILE